MKIHINSDKLIVYPEHVNVDELNFLSRTINNDFLLSYKLDDYSKMHIFGSRNELYKLLYVLSKDLDIELI